MTQGHIRLVSAITCFAGVMVCAACGRSAEQESRHREALKAFVEDGRLEGVASEASPSSEAKQLVEQVRRFYRTDDYRLVWTDGKRPAPRLAELDKTLERAETHGLPSRLYETGESAGAHDIDPEDAPEFDVRTTLSAFRYLLHLGSGRLDPHAIDRLWTLRPERPDLVKTLADAVTQNDLPAALDRLAPQSAQYGELKRALDQYRVIEAKGGWTSVPIVQRLAPGDVSENVPQLRRRLTIEGDLEASSEGASNQVFDEALAAAVRRFEERHRIKPDGIVDPTLVATMNVPVADRIRQIQLNMERWRWLPDKMPERYILVNIPDYRLEAVEHNQPVMAMRVIVGSKEQQTPVFTDEMTFVVFSPYWNIPPDIARHETIPKAANDIDALRRQNIEVVRGSGDDLEVVDPASIDWGAENKDVRLRQRPGAANALGLVKFMFPNQFNVYLHDTPGDHLFWQVQRDLSHGCVRLEEPLKLAEYVLRDRPEWTREKIEAAMHAGTERQVSLKTPIPVFIVYHTAWAENGAVRFVEDIYGHDAEQAARLWPATGAWTRARQ